MYLASPTVTTAPSSPTTVPSIAPLFQREEHIKRNNNVLRELGFLNDNNRTFIVSHITTTSRSIRSIISSSICSSSTLTKKHTDT